jgi:hypothetical protein
MARLNEVGFEKLWANLIERLKLKGPFFTALRREIKETMKELRKGAPSKEDPGLSPGRRIEGS